jgi:hypothetical protein
MLPKNVRVLAFAAAVAAMTPVAKADVTVVPQAEWAAMKTVAASNTPNWLKYDFTVAPDQPLSISATFTASTYAPGSYEPGFVSPGWFYVERACTACSYEGNVIWDMAKPYTAPFSTAYTMLLIGDVGRGTEVADYQPGATYTTTMTWNRAASTIDIHVVGGGLDLTRTVQSTGDTITGLAFQGPNYSGMPASSFGQLTVTTVPVPEPATWALMVAGIGMVGSLVRRRHGR